MTVEYEWTGDWCYWEMCYTYDNIWMSKGKAQTATRRAAVAKHTTAPKKTVTATKSERYVNLTSDSDDYTLVEEAATAAAALLPTVGITGTNSRTHEANIEPSDNGEMEGYVIMFMLKYLCDA